MLPHTLRAHRWGAAAGAVLLVGGKCTPIVDTCDGKPCPRPPATPVADASDGRAGASGLAVGGSGGIAVQGDTGVSGTTAGSDAGLRWWDDGVTAWRGIPWAEPGCMAHVAVEPERAAPPLVWHPCPGGRAGCLFFDPHLDMGDGGLPDQSVITTFTTSWTPEGYWFGVGFVVSPPGSGAIARRNVVYGPTGTAVYVVGPGVEKCYGDLPRMSPTGGRVCQVLRRSKVASLTERWACGDPREVMSFAEPTWDAGPFGGQLVRYTGELLGFGLGGSNGVYDFSQKALFQMDVPGENEWQWDPHFFEAYAFAPASFASSALDGYLWMRPNRMVALVRPAPKLVADISADRDHLVWIQADSRPIDPGSWWTNPELWASPFSTDPTEIRPRLVARLKAKTGEITSATGGGHFLLMTSPTEYTLYRLSDGREWVLPVPDGYSTDRFLHVDEREALHAVDKTTGSPIGIVRQRLDVLP